MAFDKNSYDNAFKRQAYDRVTVLVPKGKHQDLKDLAEREGKSVSALIVDAVESKYNLDLSKG